MSDEANTACATLPSEPKGRSSLVKTYLKSLFTNETDKNSCALCSSHVPPQRVPIPSAPSLLLRLAVTRAGRHQYQCGLCGCQTSEAILTATFGAHGVTIFPWRDRGRLVRRVWKSESTGGAGRKSLDEASGEKQAYFRGLTVNI